MSHHQPMTTGNVGFDDRPTIGRSFTNQEKILYSLLYFQRLPILDFNKYHPLISWADAQKADHRQ
jgi:hypothetical protein